MKIVICESNGNEHSFKINSENNIWNIINNFCEERNININNYIFLFNGNRINNTDTGSSLTMNMRKNNYIDVIHLSR